MKPKEEKNPAFSIGLFEHRDGQGVADLFRKVYGEAYPVKLVYDPKAWPPPSRQGRTYLWWRRRPTKT